MMRKIKLVALDLDGTLVNTEKKVPEGNYQVLKQCEKAGIQIVPATGRAVGGIPPMIRELPGANYAITTNGAVIADLKNNRIIKNCGLSNEMVLRILNIAKKYHAASDPYVNGRGITEPASIDHMDEFGLNPAMQQLVRDTRDVVPNVMEYMKTTGADAEKINIFMADLDEKEILRKELMAIPELSISSSMYNNLEVNAKGADKGSAFHARHVVDCGAVQVAVRILLLVQLNQLAGRAGNAAQALCLFLAAVDPYNVLRLNHVSHRTDPILNVLVACHDRFSFIS